MAHFARNGSPAVATHLGQEIFDFDEARGLIAGVCAGLMLKRCDAPVTAAFGIFLAVTAHAGAGRSVIEAGMEVDISWALLSTRWRKRASRFALIDPFVR